MQVTEGVHRLTRGVVNFYLVEDGGRFVLVDAGAPRDFGLLAATLATLGRGLGDLDAVLLTHAHSDHTGFAERVRTTAPATVWVHAADAARARGAEPGPNDGSTVRYLRHLEFYRTVFGLLRRGATRIVPIAQLSTFADAETLDVPGRPRVLHAPGHTEGSAALLLEGRGVLLTGDVVVTRNPLTGRVGPQIMPSAFNRDTDQALLSLDAVGDVPARLLLPGHGEPWRDTPAEAVRLARAAGRS